VPGNRFSPPLPLGTRRVKPRAVRMSFCLSFHQALLGPTGAHWLDDPPDLACKDIIRQHSVDDWPLSCDSVPTRERPLVPEADDPVVLVFLPCGRRRLG
jgi:hypothetical protein